MALLGFAARARAADPEPIPQPVEVDLDRLVTQLDLFEDEARRKKTTTAVTGLTLGAATIPAGIILLNRTDGVSQALVIGMLVGGVSQVLSVPLSLIPTRMDQIREKLHERIKENAAPHHTVHTIEVEWREAAVAARTKRFRVGGALLTVGVMSVASGITFLIASEGIFGMSRTAQYTWGGIAWGTGISISTIGTRFLLEWSPEETAWASYRSMRADRSASVDRSRLPSLAFLPTLGGGMACTTVRF